MLEAVFYGLVLVLCLVMSWLCTRPGKGEVVSTDDGSVRGGTASDADGGWVAVGSLGDDEVDDGDADAVEGAPPREPSSVMPDAVAESPDQTRPAAAVG